MWQEGQCIVATIKKNLCPCLECRVEALSDAADKFYLATVQTVSAHGAELESRCED